MLDEAPALVDRPGRGVPAQHLEVEVLDPIVAKRGDELVHEPSCDARATGLADDVEIGQLRDRRGDPSRKRKSHQRTVFLGDEREALADDLGDLTELLLEVDDDVAGLGHLGRERLPELLHGVEVEGGRPANLH